jgi:hypothetical protein
MQEMGRSDVRRISESDDEVNGNPRVGRKNSELYGLFGVGGKTARGGRCASERRHFEFKQLSCQGVSLYIE